MDAGFLSVVENGQYFMTKDTGDLTQFNTVACREYTLPRDEKSSDPKGWIRRNTKMGPVLEVAICCLHGKYGVEIRIMSLSRDNTHSWVRISHGSNKFVMNLNNNKTEIPKDQLEEYALKLSAKDFACRSKAKAKPQRREPENRPHGKKELDRYWTREMFSLRIRGIEESYLSSSSFTTNATGRSRSGSFLENKRKSSEPIPTVYSLVWRSLESMFGSRRRSKKDIPVLYWWFRNNCLFPSPSRTFRTQSHWSFITGQCCYSEQFLPAYWPYWMCVARGKAQGKPRHESQSPLSPQAEKYVRTERPVVCSEGAHRRVVFAHSSSYSEWNVDKTWSCQDWKIWWIDGW